MHRTILTDDVPERTTPVIEFTIVDETGAGFKPETLRLKYYDLRSLEIINSRDDQDVFDTNGVVIASNGVTDWQLEEADTLVVNAGNPAPSFVETHIALFEWTWDGGARRQRGEIQFAVTNLQKVP